MKKKSILLVEDDPSVLHVLALLLRDHYEITKCANGNEALEAWHAQPLDAIVTDLTMPFKDGLELIASIRLLDTSVPILAITGLHMGGGILAAARHMGANEVLSKPFSRSELLATLEKMFRALPQPSLNLAV